MRDAWLVFCELSDAAAGYDEETIHQLQRIDRAVVPEQDVGLYIPFDLIWARKGSSTVSDT